MAWFLLILLVFSGCSVDNFSSPGTTYRNCDSYASQPQAQRAWEAAGKPSRGDPDNDGKVCESKLNSSFTPKNSNDNSCPVNSKGVAVIRLSRREHPHIVDHIEDAVRRGRPRILTLDREDAPSNRERALQGIPTKEGYDRDEWPMAASQESSSESDIRYVNLSENRSAGSAVGRQLSGCRDGIRFLIRFQGSYPDNFNPHADFGQIRPSP